MSSLNNSVIICGASPKSTRKKTPSGIKKGRKGIKRTFYESPLKHIELSSKRWEQLQAERKLTRNVKKASNNKKNPFTSVKDGSLQDSVIILSDNECESNAKKDQDKPKKDTRLRRRLLRVANKDKQVSKSLGTSNETITESKTEEETRPKKRRKKSVVALSDNNTSCLLISDTEDSEIATVDLDDENIAPGSKSVNQGSDDIVVVWTSAKNSQSSGDQLQEETSDPEKDTRLFMIDCNPDPQNLNCLLLNEEVPPEPCKENVEKVGADKKQQEDSNYLPFSKRRLKFPKAHNVSKKIIVKKPQRKYRIRNFKRQASPVTHTIPVICNLAVAPTTSTPCEASTSDPSTPDTASAEPSESVTSERLREIVIDGNNVAMAHKNGKTFSEAGLMLVIDYFKQRGHSVKVFVPQHRRSLAHPLLEKLYTEGIVVFTPSRSIGGRWITPYDDRFILEYATMCGGIVVSLDQYRDLYLEKPEWRDTIENRLLAPTFVGDYVMFPEDPLGRKGPKLREFLRY